MNEQELQNINQIDMECHSIDDDDDTFGSINVIDDDRDLNRKTGIIIDLSDDDISTPVIKCDTNIRDAGIKTSTNITLADTDLSKVSGYNEIDLETTSFDDEDEELISKLNLEDDNIGLIDEDLLTLSETKKRPRTHRKAANGEVKTDYWKKISQKHAKSNKPGAYYSSFHFAGNPKKEQDIFNHMMKADTSDAAELNDLISTGSDINFDSVGDFGAESSGEGFSADGGGCCESLSDSNNSDINPEYSDILQNLFELLGFEVFSNSDGSYSAIDICDMISPIYADSLDTLILELNPVINDYIIYPLQSITGENFENAIDWVDWYSADQSSRYPDCDSYIGYCDVLANHLHECMI